MAKKKPRIPKDGPVWRRTAEEATLDKMPKYNAHACGTGPHGDAKYNRARQKRAWEREIGQQGARNRGLPLFAPEAAFEAAWPSMGRFRRIASPSLNHRKGSRTLQ